MSSVLGDDRLPGSGQVVRAPGLLDKARNIAGPDFKLCTTAPASATIRPGVACGFLVSCLTLSSSLCRDPLGLGLPRWQVYNQTMAIVVGVLVIGLVCHLLVHCLPGKASMADAVPAARQRIAHRDATACQGGLRTATTPTFEVVLAPPAMDIPPAWRVHRTPVAAAKFFT
jgi:hypothetical protein